MDDNRENRIYDINEHPCNIVIKNNFEYENEIKYEERNKNTKKIYENQYRYIPKLNSIINDFYQKQYNICNIYNRGFDINTILDILGEFYIIHPSETKFKRNILTGRIIDKKYISKKIIDSVNRLQNIKYIYMKKNIKINELDETEIEIYKFKHNEIIEEIIKDEQENLNIIELIEEEFKKMIKIYCLSYSYNCTDEIINIISLLCSINNIEELKDPELKDNRLFIETYMKDYNSEIINLLNIMNKFNKYNIDINKKKDIYNDNKYNEFLNLKKKYGFKIFYSNDITPLSNYEIKNFINMFNLNYNSEKRKKISIQKQLLYDLNDSIIFKKNCSDLFLNYKVINKAIQIKYTLNNIYKNNKKEIDWFKYNYPVIKSNIYDNIIKCFLEMNLNNIIIYKNNSFINLYNIDKIYSNSLLLKLINGLYFYCLDNDSVLGISHINTNLISHILNVKNILKLSKSDYDQNIIKSNKYKYDSSVYNMNQYIASL